MNSPNTSAGVSESSFIKPPPGHWKMTHPELSTKRWDEDGNLIIPRPEEFDTSQSLQQRFARGRGGRGAGRGGRAYGPRKPTEPESNGPRLHVTTPDSVDKVRKMYCTNCGAQVTTRCEEPHCMRGPCCQPKPGCARCYYAVPPPVPTQMPSAHEVVSSLDEECFADGEVTHSVESESAQEGKLPETMWSGRASKVWFVKGREVLCFERSDSDPAKPQLDTFGGHMEESDKLSFVACARRELGEEVQLDQSWLDAAEHAYATSPMGHVYHTLRPGKYYHRAKRVLVTYWFVPVQSPSKPAELTEDGQSESREGTLAWRPAKVVFENLSQFEFLKPLAGDFVRLVSVCGDVTGRFSKVATLQSPTIERSLAAMAEMRRATRWTGGAQLLRDQLSAQIDEMYQSERPDRRDVSIGWSCFRRRSAGSRTRSTSGRFNVERARQNATCSCIWERSFPTICA